MDLNLNAGGILGGLLGAVIGFAVFFVMDNSDHGRTTAKFVIFGVIGGALAGNFLWGLVAGKPKVQPQPDQEDDHEGRRHY